MKIVVVPAVDLLPASSIAITVTSAVPTFFPDSVVLAPLPGETVATEPGVLVQLMVRSVTTVPLTSLTVADMTFDPDVVTESPSGATDTDPTGALIERSVFAPLFPSLVAVIVVLPAVTPVTRPAAVTVATAVLLDCHVTVRPVSTFPAASFVTAASCVV